MKEKILVLAEPGLLRCSWLLDVKQALTVCPAADAEVVRALGWQFESFNGGNLYPARDDIEGFRRLLNKGDVVLGRDLNRPRGYESVYTALGLAGVETFTELSQKGGRTILSAGALSTRPRRLLLKACGGIGNLMQVSCIAGSALRQGIETLFLPIFDATMLPIPELFDDHHLDGLTIIDGDIPIEVDVSINVEAKSYNRPEDYHHNLFGVGTDLSEAELSARFFSNVTGLPGDASAVIAGGYESELPAELTGRIVVCPGSKLGWDSKRWPHMNALLKTLREPVLLCRPSDLEAYERLEHLTAIDLTGVRPALDLTLSQAIAVMRNSIAVVANDCGLAHMAAASGAPTLILFGPSFLNKNRPPGKNVNVLYLDLDCRPCQGADMAQWPGTLGFKTYQCRRRYACMQNLTPQMVTNALSRMIDPTLWCRHLRN